VSADSIAMVYGVDTPSLAELIAANHSVEEIRRFVEADSLGYLSLGALVITRIIATPATPITILPS